MDGDPSKVNLTDRRKHPFYLIENSLIDEHGPVIGVYGIAVYNVLAYYANQKNAAWPSYQTIADKVGASRPKVIETVKMLVDRGIILKHDRKTPAGDATSNEYVLVNVTVVNDVDQGSKQDLPPSKQDLPRVVNEVNQGSKPRLPEQDPIEQNPGEQECSSAGADAPPTDPDYDAVFGKGTAGFDPPVNGVKASALDWEQPLGKMPAHQAMFAAVLDAIGWDRATLTERDRGQVAQACRVLLDAGYGYTDIGEFMQRVWFRDWRWEKNESRPTLNQLRQEIGKVKAGIPVELPRRQTKGGDAVDAVFDRLEREGYFA